MNTTDTDNVAGKGAVLCIDIGNNAIKSAVYDNKSWQAKPRIGHQNIDSIINWINNDPVDIQLVLVSSVVDTVLSALTEKKVDAEIIPVTLSSIPENYIDYKTPKTLGLDRYMACLGAFKQVEDAVIVVDAGTACTVDLMDRYGVFQGGVIMPGISLCEESLQQNAEALPPVSRNLPDTWPGKSTEECMQWGITGSFLHAVENHINQLLNITETSHIFITGGDAELLAEYLSLQRRVDPLLVMKGLLAWQQLYIV